MSDKELNDLSNWLLKAVGTANVRAEDLIAKAAEKYSPSDVTWAIWYLKSAGRLRLTKDDLIASA